MELEPRDAEMDDARAKPGRSPALWLTLCLGVFVSIWGWLWTSRQVDERGRMLFEKQWSSIAGALRERVQLYQEILRATSGLFLASEKVERAEWTAFVSALDLNQFYPGIHTLGFAARQGGATGAAIPRLGTGAANLESLTFPVTFIEPGQQDVQRTLGMDLGRDPFVRDALIKSFETDEVAVTARIRWPESPGDHFAMVVPTFLPGVTESEMGRRVERLRGFLFCTFRVSDFMKGLMPHRAPGIDVELYDGPAILREGLIFDDDGRADGLLTESAGDAGLFRHSELMPMNGRVWTLHVNSRPDFDHQLQRWQAWAVLGGGLLATLLLVLLVRFQMMVRDWAVTLAVRMTGRLRELSAHVLDLQDQERARIARELHDSTAQHLGLAANRIAGLQERISSNREESKELEDALVLIRQATQEVRTLSYLLHPPTLDLLGLAGALEDLARGFESRSGVRVHCEVPTQFRRPVPEVEMALFRVAQEGLTNVLRHSSSPEAWLRLTQSDQEIALVIMDRGKGIPAEKLKAMNEFAAHLGVGIAGMRERMEQLGGKLVLERGSPGTVVRALVPASTFIPINP